MTPGVVKAEAKFLIILGAAAAIFAAGWLVGGWRKDAEIARLEQHYAQAQAADAQMNMRALNHARGVADAAYARLAAAENTLEKLNQEKANAIRSLTVGRRCLDRAAVRVLNGPLPTGLNVGAAAEATGDPVPADAPFATDTDVGLWIGQCQRGYETCRGRLAAIADFYRGVGDE